MNPNVQILIPVYNGADHLEECLASVRSQTLRTWTAIIVNNCSSDGTAAIAEACAREDPRFRVMHCTEFVGQAENYNRAIGQASADCDYLKIVEADNWIAQDALERMVDVAQRHPEAGLVGGYCLLGSQVIGDGVEHQVEVLAGREVWRLLFEEDRYLFGTPTTLLFRAKALLDTKPWLRPELFYDDVDLCVRMLARWQLGYVHQVVGFVRTDNAGIFSAFQDFDYREAYLSFLAADYASRFVEEGRVTEVQDRFKRAYYRRLAHAILSGRARAYWGFHRKILGVRNEKLDSLMIAQYLAAECVDLLLNPKSTIERMMRRNP